MIVFLLFGVSLGFAMGMMVFVPSPTPPEEPQAAEACDPAVLRATQKALARIISVAGVDVTGSSNGTYLIDLPGPDMVIKPVFNEPGRPDIVGYEVISQ